MDRGGHFAGTLKEPETGSFIGGLAAKVRRRSPRTPADVLFAPRRKRNHALEMIERLTPRGAGVIATVLMLAGSLGFGVVKGGHLDAITETVRDARDAVAKSAGFNIAAVNISGRKHMTQDEVLAIGGVTGRRSLLFLDAADVRDRLKANPWIADATVLKLYPDRLSIEITERNAFALWQDHGQLSLIAADGAVLEPFVSRNFASLPLVVGKGGATRAKDFLDLLAGYPQISNDVKAIVFVGERRWNLRLANGLDIRLPETGVQAALDRLVQLDREDRLLSRDIVAIDLRLPDRVTVRLSDDAAKARADMLKAKAKAAKKATEA